MFLLLKISTEIMIINYYANDPRKMTGRNASIEK